MTSVVTHAAASANPATHGQGDDRFEPDGAVDRGDAVSGARPRCGPAAASRARSPSSATAAAATPGRPVVRLVPKQTTTARRGTRRRRTPCSVRCRPAWRRRWSVRRRGNGCPGGACSWCGVCRAAGAWRAIDAGSGAGRREGRVTRSPLPGESTHRRSSVKRFSLRERTTILSLGAGRLGRARGLDRVVGRPGVGAGPGSWPAGVPRLAVSVLGRGRRHAGGRA